MMIHSYQSKLRLVRGMTHASFGLGQNPLAVSRQSRPLRGSAGGRSSSSTTTSSRSSASGRNGSDCVTTVGPSHFVFSPASKRVLRNTMASVCIIGSGNWGSAIAKIVGTNAKKQNSFADRVTMYVYEEIIDGKKLTEIINQTHENIKYLPGHKIPENVVAIPDVIEAAKDADILIFVVPHQFIHRICNSLQGKIKPTAVGLSLIKGFDKKEGGGIELISHIISKQLQIPISVLMGANLASEVADEMFCETTIGCKDKVMAPILRNLIQTSYFRVVVVEDVDSVECCGALKNIVACGAGFVDGLGLGDNTKAAVIRLGLMEMIKFVDVFFPGGKLSTFFESCGVADLITTCYGGRNRKVSEAFIKTGKLIETLEKEMLNGQKLQGPFTAEEVNYMLKSKNMENRFPLFTAIHRICIRELKPTDFIDCIRSHPEHMDEDISPSSMMLKSPKCHL